VKPSPKSPNRIAALLVTSDAAGASHGLIDWLIRQNHAADRCVEFSVGFDVDADVRTAIGQVRGDCWVPALDNTDGTARGDADVTEITTLMHDRLARTGWPRRLRVIVRRTRLAPGEQPTLFHLDGYKYSCFVTTTSLNLQLLDARHRAHARVEDQVRTTKDTGLGTCRPSPGRSTPAGARPWRSRPTCWPGSNCSAAPKHWPAPSRRRCATGC
jgi:hypothetical protein